MLTQEEKEKMIVALRGTSVAKENITEEYKKNLDLAEREEVGTVRSISMSMVVDSYAHMFYGMRFTLQR